MSDDEPLLVLPEDLRAELKEPLGPIATEAEAVLETADRPILAVGDVVTHHLREAGAPPDVAVVDGMTERSPVDEDVSASVERDVAHRVTNPAATITAAMVEALAEALEQDGPATVLVDGEEDLAALPAVLLAPEGATVLYGQPGAGMVVVTVDEDRKSAVMDLLEGFDGDLERFRSLVA